MKESKYIIILGSGHLAFQVKRKFIGLGFAVKHIPRETFETRGGKTAKPLLELFRGAIRGAGIDKARAVYILDDQDRFNIQFALVAISLNGTIPIIVSLFNEDLAPHFQATHKNLFIRNPALVAAPVFVETLKAPVQRSSGLKKITPRIVLEKTGIDRWLIGFAACLLTLLTGGTIFFRVNENLAWVDALYFTVTLMDLLTGA